MLRLVSDHTRLVEIRTEIVPSQWACAKRVQSFTLDILSNMFEIWGADFHFLLGSLRCLMDNPRATVGRYPELQLSEDIIARLRLLGLQVRGPNPSANSSGYL